MPVVSPGRKVPAQAKLEQERLSSLESSINEDYTQNVKIVAEQKDMTKESDRT